MKRGTVREDGKIFARMAKGKELWITKEQYEKRENSRKEYTKKCLELYKKYRKEKKSIGQYDHKKNLYFIGISTSGKEVWKNKAYLEKFRKKQNKNKKKYNQKCSLLPKTNLKFGDQHPDNPELFVIHKIGNKCFFGNKERLEEKKESLRIVRVKRYYKSKKVRQLALQGLEARLVRGTTRTEDNFIFFGYDRIGKEIWYPPEVYHQKRNKELLKRKEKRLRKKLANKSQEQNSCQNENISFENP